MCLHRSYVVTEDYKVLASKECDHHTEIRKLHGIRDDLHEAKLKNCSVEFRPIHELFDLNGWEFHFDEPTKPKWWTKEHMSKVQTKLEEEYMRYCALDSTYVFPGELCLDNLRGFNKEGCTIISSGPMLLRQVNTLPPRTTLIAKKGPILLDGLRHCYDGVNLIAETVNAHPSVLREANVVAYRYRRQQYVEYTQRAITNYRPLNPNSTAMQQLANTSPFFITP
jgi:hypothetical protein